MPDIDVRLKRNGDYWLAWWWHPTQKGRRVGKSLGARSKISERRANAMCRQLAMDMKQGKVKPASDIPLLSEWLTRHSELVKNLRPGTRLIYVMAGQYLTRHFDDDPRIDHITAGHAAEWHAAMSSGELSLDNQNRCDRPGVANICKYVRTIKAIFNAAVEATLIPKNPFANLSGNAPAPDSDWHQLTAGDMCAIFESCPNDGYRALFALARWAGLRRDEARQLQWGDVLWDKNRIAVNARVKDATTKWRKRVCPIELRDHPTGFRDLLRMWFENAAPGTPGPCHGVDKHNLYIKVEKILNAAGVVYESPFHTARKCWETELSMKFPLHVVVSWLGNTFEVARKHYLRVPEELYGDEPAAMKVPEIVVYREGRFRVQSVPDQPPNGRQLPNGQTTGTGS